MAIAFDSTWGNTFTGAASGVTLGTHAPTATSSTVMGWCSVTSANVVSNGGSISITDSVSGAVPAAQIINMGINTGGANNYQTFFFWYNISTNTTRTITAGWTGATGKATIVAFAFTGLATTAPLDQSPTGALGTNATPTTPTTGTTLGANEVVLTFWMADSGSAVTWAAPVSINGWGTSGFNGLGNLTNTSVPQFDAGYLIVSQTGTGSGSISSTISAPWQGNIVTMSATTIVPPVTNTATGSGVDKFIPRLLRRKPYVTRQQKQDRKKKLDEWASENDTDSQES